MLFQLCICTLIRWFGNLTCISVSASICEDICMSLIVISISYFFLLCASFTHKNKIDRERRISCNTSCLEPRQYKTIYVHRMCFCQPTVLCLLSPLCDMFLFIALFLFKLHIPFITNAPFNTIVCGLFANCPSVFGIHMGGIRYSDWLTNCHFTIVIWSKKENYIRK